MDNVSTVADSATATTHTKAAAQRAEHLAILGVGKVLELCVGPSLKTLQQQYAAHNIHCVGNDIDRRWEKYYKAGQWRIGDCLSVDWTGVDAVVFAPPLSRGCSGTREDALRVSEVFPAYTAFLQEWSRRGPDTAVLVLPARSLATQQDRREYRQLLYLLSEMGICSVEPVELVVGCRKYVDLYLTRY